MATIVKRFRSRVVSAAVSGDWRSLRAAADFDQLRLATLEYVKALGFHYFSYTVRYALQRTPRQFAFGNYPTRWRNRYAKAGYEHIDPTVLHCMRHVTPIIWDADLFCGEREARLIEEARRYGLNTGVSFPVHRAGSEMAIFSLVSREDEAKFMPWIRAMLASGHQLALQVHEAAVQLLEAQPQAARHDHPLTPREIECVQLAAAGKTAREIARLLGVAESTVIYHFRRVGQKFNLTDRKQIVARAIGLGLIRWQ
jgi:LuxR family quorum-sensing transcriptional regulator LasR